MIKPLVTTFLLLAVSACSVVSDEDIIRERSARWVGQPISEVIKGNSRPPSREMVLPDKTKVYIWSLDTSFKTSTKCREQEDGGVRCTGGKQVQRACELTAFANKKGIVTSVQSSGCGHLKIGDLEYRL